MSRFIHYLPIFVSINKQKFCKHLLELKTWWKSTIYL